MDKIDRAMVIIVMVGYLLDTTLEIISQWGEASYFWITLGLFSMIYIGWLIPKVWVVGRDS